MITLYNLENIEMLHLCLRNELKYNFHIRNIAKNIKILQHSVLKTIIIIKIKINSITWESLENFKKEFCISYLRNRMRFLRISPNQQSIRLLDHLYWIR